MGDDEDILTAFLVDKNTPGIEVGLYQGKGL